MLNFEPLSNVGDLIIIASVKMQNMIIQWLEDRSLFSCDFTLKNMHKYTNKSSWNCFYIECDKTDKLKVHLLTYSWQLSHTAGSVSMFVCLFQPKILMQIDQQLHKCLRFSPHFNFLSWSFHVRWNALNGQKCVDIQTLLPSVVIIINHQMLQPAAELRRLVN